MFVAPEYNGNEEDYKKQLNALRTNAAPEVTPTGLPTIAQQVTNSDKYSEVQSNRPVETVTEDAMRASNTARDIYLDVQRNQIPPDPNFDPKKHEQELTASGVSTEYYPDLFNTKSLAEFRNLKSEVLAKDDARQRVAASGYKGLVGEALAGMYDIDAPLMLMTDGIWAGPKTAKILAKMGMTGRAGAMGAQAVGGAEIMGGSAAIGAAATPGGHWSDIPGAALGGMAFGAAFGALGKNDILDRLGNEKVLAMKDDVKSGVLDGSLGKYDPRDVGSASQVTTVVEPKAPVEMPGSAGASATGRTPVEGVSSSTSDFMVQARQYLRNTDVAQKARDFINSEEPLVKAGRRFYDAIKGTALGTDWDKFANSSSIQLKAYANQLMESASGIIRNNRSAIKLKDYYENNLLDVVRHHNLNYPEYAAAQGKTWRDADYHFKLRDQFDREVMLELNSRLHDGEGLATSHPSIKKTADAIDQYSTKAIDYMRGKEGEIPVAGSELLEPRSGWFRQIWHGNKMSEVMSSMKKLGLNGEKAVTQAISTSYQKLHNFMPEDADIYAKAVVRGAIARSTGVDTNLIRLLQQDGRIQLEKFLVDGGATVTKAQELVDKLLKIDAEKQKPGTLKRRLDVDLREQIPGTDKTLLDLVDTDVRKVWSRYARGVSGDAALARNGIQHSEKQARINSIKEELASKNDTSVPEGLIDHMWTPFEAGPVGGGVNPWVSRAMRLTNLALMNTVGLIQGGETGAIIGAVGWQAFKDTAPKALREMLAGKSTPIVEQIEKWSGPVGDLHKMQYDSYAMDMLKRDPQKAVELGTFLDGLLSKGSVIQGYVSAFYHMHTLQQRVTVEAMTHKLGHLWTGSKKLEDLGMSGDLTLAQNKRLYDIGLDPETASRVQTYFKDGTVTYDEAGNVANLNFQHWQPTDIEDFRLALNTHTYQTVQKIMYGEGAMWWHTTEGAALMQLKTFTLAALQKQALRNLYLADPEAKAGLIYGLMTASIAYSARQALTGKTDNLTPMKVMNGAMNMSNMTGFVPMFVDPVASMFGMDDLRFNHYGMTDINSGIISPPVMFPALNRMAHIPGALYGLGTGTYTKNDIYALQATPIIGNMAGTAAVFQAMRDDADKNKKPPE